MALKHEKFKSELLYEEKKKKEAAEKLSKLQEGFNKFEKGALSPDKLINYISKDLEIPVNDRLKREIKNPGFDYQSFRHLVKNLNFLKDEKTEYRQASNQIKKNSRNDISKSNNTKQRESFKDSKLI